MEGHNMMSRKILGASVALALMTAGIGTVSGPAVAAPDAEPVVTVGESPSVTVSETGLEGTTRATRGVFPALANSGWHVSTPGGLMVVSGSSSGSSDRAIRLLDTATGSQTDMKTAVAFHRSYPTPGSLVAVGDSEVYRLYTSGSTPDTRRLYVKGVDYKTGELTTDSSTSFARNDVWRVLGHDPETKDIYFVDSTRALQAFNTESKSLTKIRDLGMMPESDVSYDPSSKTVFYFRDSAPYKSIESYSISSDTTKQYPSMRDARHRAALQYAEGKLYVFGGTNEWSGGALSPAYVKSIEIMDLEGETWSVSGSELGIHTDMVWADMSSVHHDGKVYLAAHESVSGAEQHTYDIESDTIISRTALRALSEAQTVARDDDGKFWISSADGQISSFTQLESGEIANFKTHYESPLPAATSFTGSFAHGGFVYFVRGSSAHRYNPDNGEIDSFALSSSSSDDVEFDPSTETVFILAGSGIKRYSLSDFSVIESYDMVSAPGHTDGSLAFDAGRNRLWVVGGSSSNLAHYRDLSNPDSTWAQTPPLGANYRAGEAIIDSSGMLRLFGPRASASLSDPRYALLSYNPDSPSTPWSSEGASTPYVNLRPVSDIIEVSPGEFIGPVGVKSYKVDESNHYKLSETSLSVSDTTGLPVPRVLIGESLRLDYEGKYTVGGRQKSSIDGRPISDVPLGYKLNADGSIEWTGTERPSLAQLATDTLDLFESTDLSRGSAAAWGVPALSDKRITSVTLAQDSVSLALSDASHHTYPVKRHNPQVELTLTDDHPETAASGSSVDLSVDSAVAGTDALTVRQVEYTVNGEAVTPVSGKITITVTRDSAQ